MDFYQIKRDFNYKKGLIEIYPDFKVCRSKDLMVRGNNFYAIWDKEKGLWSTDEYDVQRLVDQELAEQLEKMKEEYGSRAEIKARWLKDFSSNSWVNFKKYINRISDNSHQLDENLTFADCPIKRTDFVSKRLPYSLEEGEPKAYDELMTTLYDPEEREKIEWAIGSILSGDSKNIQKFIVMHGEAGTGKSTVINIIQMLFEGYYTTFEAKALASNTNAFATEVFKNNPLVAVQHDGDLSKIEDNTKLNSIISHEEMTINEKYKSSYSARINCFLFLGSNKPVKITDAKSGIIRRLIDVSPSGRKLPPKKYQALYSQIGFELGKIANHCLNVYRSLGKDYYSGYIPFKMIYQTDVFFNFVEDSFDIFKEQDGVSLKQAYSMYKDYCDETLIPIKLPMYRFREELKSYFNNFEDVVRLDGKQYRSYYSGFKIEKFKIQEPVKEERPCSLVIDSDESIFDKECSDLPAQYANDNGTPERCWSDNKLTLKDIDTRKLHYVKLPLNHIVIDFDIKDSKGNKSAQLNLEAASKWPATYAEYSKSGSGIHLHYIYDGDPNLLSNIFSEGIEIKVFKGKSSLRRKFTKSNNTPIATISSGLPLKGEKMVNFSAVKNEKALRTIIQKNLDKEYHPGTKPSIDFIYKSLEDAYNGGVHYDVTDMRPKILAFANNSTNHSEYCVKLVSKMKFRSEEPSDANDNYDEDQIVFYDVEVVPNLFHISWKIRGKDHKCVRMQNPTPAEIEPLLKMKLVGFNCRRYDNHILYARYLGYTNEQLYELSQRIINESKNSMFGEAYNISYTDIYDFASKKQSLKKWEIELGIHHHELGLPWDQPIPKEMWGTVGDYCDDDVYATEAVFDYLEADWTARQILADLSGLTVNDTTQQHVSKIIFGNDPNPQSKFIYKDLSEEFPGYEFKNGKSSYKGEDPSEGGYVYAEPGCYGDVALLDIQSMHPSTIEALNYFGPYTKRFSELKGARIAVKHYEIENAKNMLNGVLTKYLTDESQMDKLAYALKIAINIVYGLTAAKFDNKFRHPKNVDNIVAKRGALFMINLKGEVMKRGFKVAHIKTDSIKIPDATPEIIQFVMDYGKQYGYIFEHEATYDKMCLVNNAVYIAKYKDAKDCVKLCGYSPKENAKHGGQWTATGAQFAHPYIFKRLFSNEEIAFADLCEARSVQTAMYLDFNEGYFDVTELEEEKEKREKLAKGKSVKLNPRYSSFSDEALQKAIDDGHNYFFVGKTGLFCPVKPDTNGGILVRKQGDKYYSVTGCNGYRWKESEIVKETNSENDIDIRYFDELLNTAIRDISNHCSISWFTSDQPYAKDDNGILPF